MSNINKTIDKAQQEAATIQSQGIKQYIWSRQTSMSLGSFLIIILSAFIVGAILF